MGKGGAEKWGRSEENEERSRLRRSNGKNKRWREAGGRKKVKTIVDYNCMQEES
jgi:hypothetical protein